jgi:hypothetical protein
MGPEPAPSTMRSRPTRALDDTGPRRWEPVGLTGHHHQSSAGDARSEHGGMVQDARAEFLERLAVFYVILADKRNWRGVTPTTRLKCWENWL